MICAGISTVRKRQRMTINFDSLLILRLMDFEKNCLHFLLQGPSLEHFASVGLIWLKMFDLLLARAGKPILRECQSVDTIDKLRRSKSLFLLITGLISSTKIAIENYLFF